MAGYESYHMTNWFMMEQKGSVNPIFGSCLTRKTLHNKSGKYLLNLGSSPTLRYVDHFQFRWFKIMVIKQNFSDSVISWQCYIFNHQLGGIVCRTLYIDSPLRTFVWSSIKTNKIYSYKPHIVDRQLCNSCWFSRVTDAFFYETKARNDKLIML